MTYVPPGQPFANASPGVPASGPALDAAFFNNLVDGVVDHDDRLARTDRHLDIISPLDFGAEFDGATDDRAAIQACIDWAAQLIRDTDQPVTVSLPAGTAYLGSGVTVPTVGSDQGPWTRCGIKLPVNLPATLTIRGAGRGRTTFKLSDACRNVFWIGKTADYDTFQNVTTEDFDVDNNNTVGQCHILIGNIPAQIQRQRRLNFANLVNRRHTIYNVPVDLTNAVSQKVGIGYMANHVNAGQDGTQATALVMEATQTRTDNVLVEDVDQYGGANHTAVCAWPRSASYLGVGPTNHYHDNILFRRLRHVNPNPANVGAQQTSFYITGAGLGGYCEFVDCYSENISDDAIEVGAMQTCVIERFRSKDAYLVSILIRISQPPVDVDSQVYVIRNHDCRVTSAIANGSSPDGKPVNVLVDNGCVAGTVIIEDSKFDYRGQKYSVAGNLTPFLTVDQPVKRLVLRNQLVTWSGYTFDATATTIMSAVRVQPATSNFTTVDIENLDLRVTGLAQTGTGVLVLHGVLVEGAGPHVSVDGLDVDYSGVTFNTTGGSTSLLSVAAFGVTSNARLVARRVRAHRSAPANNAVSRYGVRIYGVGTVQQAVLTDSYLGSASGLNVDVDTATAGANAAALRLRGNTLLAAPSSIVITPTGTPFTWRNTTGIARAVTVSGGTVTLVEQADSAGTTYRSTGLTSGTFLVDAGQYLRITYGAVPTLVAFPLPG